MHFQMKVQPISFFLETNENWETTPVLASSKPVLKSRLKRLFDRKNNNNNNSEKLLLQHHVVGDGSELEPSSVCLAKMVENFMEDTTAPEKPKCNRNRCNCFNGNLNDISDDDDDQFDSWPSNDPSETLKSLTPCSSIGQRNLLADTSKLVEKNKAACKRKDELRKLVAEGLVFIGHDASICKSHWDKTSSYPAGEYEYLDVIIDGGQRVVIDIDFRSEFEIARPTGTYKAILNSLPYIYVGQADRLQQIISIISEAAKLSLKKKGMPVPPWRKFDYMKSKWLSPHTRTPSPSPLLLPPLPMPPTPPPTPDSKQNIIGSSVFSSQDFESECGVFEMIIGDETTASLEKSDDGFHSSAAAVTWQPPAIKPRNVERGSKLVVTGLASLFKEKNI